MRPTHSFGTRQYYQGHLADVRLWNTYKTDEVLISLHANIADQYIGDQKVFADKLKLTNHLGVNVNRELYVIPENIDGIKTISGNIATSSNLNTSNYIMSTQTNLTALINTKQNILTAGTNISIVGSTINATGTSLATIGNIATSSNLNTSNYIMSTQTNLTALINTKQNTLTAGTNINIVGNTISATGSSSLWTASGTDIIYSAGRVIVGNDDLTIRNGNTTVGNTKDNILFGFDNTDSFRHSIKSRHNTAIDHTGNSIDFYLWKRGQSSTDIGNNHMASITAGGVGINGKTTPSFALDVIGDVNCSGNFKINGTNLSTIFAPSTHSHTTSDITGLDTALAGKQATLTAGSNISIIGNTISLTSGSILWTNNTTNLSYGNVKVYNDKITIFTTGSTVIKYPRETITSSPFTYTDGTVVRASASSQFSDYFPFRLFNQQLYTVNNEWATSGGYSGGVSSTTSYYFNNDTSFHGNWAMVDLGERIVLSSYKIYPINGYLIRAPKDLRIYATNDDASYTNTKSMNWTEIDSQINIPAWAQNTPKTFTLSSVPAPYRYYAMIVNKIQTNDPYLQLTEWELYGFSFIEKSLIKENELQTELAGKQATLTAGTNITISNNIISSTGGGFVAWADITSKPTTFTPSTHTHLWADITNKPTTFAPSTHTHLWADITDKPTTFTPSTHTHLWADITDKPTTFTPSTHTHLWANITDKPTTFTPSTHTHTTSDITGLAATLAGKQNTLAAGTGISISGSTISSTVSPSQFTTSGANIYFTSGNTGLGNINPQYRLDIGGDINITGTLRKNGVDLLTVSGLRNTHYLSATVYLNPNTLYTYSIDLSSLPTFGTEGARIYELNISHINADYGDTNCQSAMYQVFHSNFAGGKMRYQILHSNNMLSNPPIFISGGNIISFNLTNLTASQIFTRVILKS